MFAHIHKKSVFPEISGTINRETQGIPSTYVFWETHLGICLWVSQVPELNITMHVLLWYNKFTLFCPAAMFLISLLATFCSSITCFFSASTSFLAFSCLNLSCNAAAAVGCCSSSSFCLYSSIFFLTTYHYCFLWCQHFCCY